MMDNSKLISVIVPVYNVEKYLDRCLQSILSQTYNPIEIILVDDGSTDSSSEMCDNYARCNYNIKVIHKQNQGLPDARNTGLEHANGDMIGFVDSDDFVEPDMFEKLYIALEEQQADISVCGFIKEFDKEIKYEHYGNRILSGLEGLNEIVRVNGAGGNSASNKLYRKEIIKNFRYPSGYLFEDIIATYRLYEKANKIAIIDDTLYHYMIREGSITTKHRLEKMNKKLVTLHDRAKDLESRHLDLAMAEYNKVTNMAMENCITLYNKDRQDLYEEAFQVGKSCLNKTLENKSISIIRKIIYKIFYHHSKMFYALKLDKIIAQRKL